MISLGISEFIRNIKKNILIIILFIVVYVLSIFIVSAFMEQYRQYDGVSEYFDSTGLFLTTAMFYDSDEQLVTDDEFKDKLVKVEGIERMYYANFFTSEDVELPQGTTMSLVAWDTKTTTYVPKLLEGEWCEDAEAEEGIINIVVSANMPFEVTVGQKVEFGGYTFKITGIVGMDEPIYGMSTGFSPDSLSYLNYYGTAADRTEYVMVAAYNDNLKSVLGNTLYEGGYITIDFEDDITADEIDKNIEAIKDNFNVTGNVDEELYIYNNSDVHGFSMRLLEIKLMPMVVILIVVVMILIISMVVSGAVNILYEKKNYGIYFICGNNWGKTFMFSLVNWFTLAVSALIVSVSICMLVKTFPVFDGLVLTFGIEHICVIGAITVSLLVAALLIPYCMLRKITPVSILKENDK